MSKKGEATAQRILDAAYKSIAARGCGVVTLQDIAGEAGVVVSQLCYYFGNKDGLFTAVLKRAGHAYLEGLGLWLRCCGTLAEHVITFVNYNEFILRDSPNTYRIFLEFYNFAKDSTGFQLEVANLTSEIASVVETCIANKTALPRRGIQIFECFSRSLYLFRFTWHCPPAFSGAGDRGHAEGI